jgi:hypothetical protein
MNLNDFLDDYEAGQLNDMVRELYDLLMDMGASSEQIDRIDAIITEILGE